MDGAPVCEGVESKAEGKLLTVCGTCPWLKVNHGKKHSAKWWYSLANLRRLWNGLRTGKAPGMVCHSTDPDSKEYGSEVNVKETSEKRECAGAVILVIKHCNEMGDIGMPAYKAKWGKTRLGMTLRGFRYWFERCLFGRLPRVEDRSAEVAEPGR